jgi:hypothetical protein
MEAIKEEGDKRDWDPSVKSEKQKMTAEDRVAAKLAAEVLRDNAKLRGIHSNTSIKKLLEKEAKKYMKENGGEYKGPIVSRIKDKEI